MDEIVARAMQKWPNVPNVFGWLRLDRRGQWRVKDRDGRFSTITNTAVNEFIGRNYAADERGRWFFQNGPQRVFVSLECAPWVWRFNGRNLTTHTGIAAGRVSALFVDDSGALLALAQTGPGSVHDRDLEAFAARLVADNPALGDEDGLLEAARRGATVHALGAAVPLSTITAAELAVRFGFDPDPRPAPGQPDC